jgi:hypothetical protein
MHLFFIFHHGRNTNCCRVIIGMAWASKEGFAKKKHKKCP